MSLVVDASVAAKWYLAESNSRLAQQRVDAGHERIAPELLLVEVANTLFKAWARGVIDDVHMDSSLDHLPTAFAALPPRCRPGGGCRGDFANTASSGIRWSLPRARLASRSEARYRR